MCYMYVLKIQLNARTQSGLKPLVLIPKGEHTGSGSITVGYNQTIDQGQGTATPERSV